ncbi:MAG TPA: hypothetical protein VGW11_10340 [Solirubrobacteraceae bacterium]|nr:hypothetical protein [Solirubrobacteraceae bacterium]
MRATVLASLVLALAVAACGGDPDVIDATPEAQPTLTIPGGGAGAGALGEDPTATTTTPDGEPAPEGTAPEGQTPGDEAAPGQAEPGAAPEGGAAPEDPAAEFGDFCEQNPGVEGC